MPSINVDLDYFGHPKTIKLIGLLGDGADVLPVRLWCYTAKFYKMDGLLEGYSDNALEDVMGWRGERGLCIKAMVDVGFLDVIDTGYAVHEWKDHAAHIIAYHLKSKKMVKARLEKIKGENVDNFSPLNQSPIENSPSSNTTNKSSSNSSGYHHALPMQGEAEQNNAFQYHAMQSNTEASVDRFNNSDAAFVLKLSDDEYLHWCSRIQSLINKENEGRINNKFVWSLKGMNPVDEWKLLFNRFSDEDKSRLLLEGSNVLKGKLVWANYVELAIMVAVRRSAKIPIKIPIAFVFDLLKKPAGIISDCVDGILKGYVVK